MSSTGRTTALHAGQSDCPRRRSHGPAAAAGEASPFPHRCSTGRNTARPAGQSAESKIKRGCEKSPLHQEHSNINTVGADAAQAGLSCPFGAIHLPPGGPAERILNNTLPPGESVTLYVFAGAFCFIFGLYRSGRRASAPTLSIDFFHSPPFASRKNCKIPLTKIQNGRKITIGQYRLFRRLTAWTRSLSPDRPARKRTDKACPAGMNPCGAVLREADHHTKL